HYYQTHFFKNTIINGIDCSDMDVATAVRYVQELPIEYELEIIGRDEDGNKLDIGVIQAKDIGLSIEGVEEGITALLEQQNELLWITSLGDTIYSYKIATAYVFEEALLESVIDGMAAFQKENMVEPKDAYIGGYEEQKNAYVLIPETKGSKLKMRKVRKYIKEAVCAMETSIDLEVLGCYVEAYITSEDKTLLRNWNQINTWLKTQITYDWNSFEVVLDNDTLKDWIWLEGGIPVLDEEAVAEFVRQNAETYDTYGKNRQFVTSQGVELTLGSGAFGWKTDQEGETKALINLIKEGSILDREPVYSSKAPRKGISDIGSSYLEADLTNQHLYLYKDGVLVLESDFVSGEANNPANRTPSGVFGITYKTTNAVLRGADYETPVTYWMPFHGNFGMHDATWRTEFGGDIYLTNGSHGCLNLPLESAAAIYNYMYTGFPVICYY
ncbi:MAG: L,D-transpeptidase/peptidoglycan binding protein, partial [Lachnospiraceae bacterium]|nr:L,D-transpeptidase/peptidoglycan binding protein [Lachnospiraceae bacterium]